MQNAGLFYWSVRINPSLLFCSSRNPISTTNMKLGMHRLTGEPFRGVSRRRLDGRFVVYSGVHMSFHHIGETAKAANCGMSAESTLYFD